MSSAHELYGARYARFTANTLRRAVHAEHVGDQRLRHDHFVPGQTRQNREDHLS
jgi:hypothetical protein